MKSPRLVYLPMFVLLFLVPSLAMPASAGRAKVTVFNFQMKTQTPEWTWLEKGLADRIITDLFQDKSIYVIQRDKMQMLAQRMNWVPEMMGDPERLEAILKAFKPDYLVFGVYEVKAGKLSITAIVVNLETKKEAARYQVSGRTDEAIELTRKISASLISFLTKRPVEKILKELPVWTRSIPATKALYQGMNLYDQGRYGEAWLKFRQASRDAPEYREASYWVGRMYYFMDRYEHARLAYDRFVYLTGGSHPRMGDAIKEYLHTYEKLNVHPEILLVHYDALAKRYPQVYIHNEMGVSWIHNKLWLWTKSAELSGQIGRHVYAAKLASKVIEELTVPPEDRQYWLPTSAQNYAYCIAMGNAQMHNMLTGKALMPYGLEQQYRANPLRFKPGQKETVSCYLWPLRPLLKRFTDGKTRWKANYMWWFVVAPDGYVFKTLRFYPVVQEYGSQHIYLGVCMHKDSYADIPGLDRSKKLRDAAKTGARFNNLPRSGLLHVHNYLYTKRPFEEPSVHVKGIRAVAELEKIGPHGAIEVASTNTVRFRVDVDGRRGRKGPGLIGLIPPGPHTLRFYPGHGRAPFSEWITKVDVKEGKTIHVEVSLPWKKGAGWSDWTSVRIGRKTPLSQFGIKSVPDCPYIQADDGAIRVVWSNEADLWTSTSTDGEHFSDPVKLPMPISSGWVERDPVLLRDESGRFILAFLSDRNGQYEYRPYVCWSRDFVNWSAPVMIQDRPMSYFDMIQDDRGRFIFVDNAKEKLTVLVSRDAYHWQRVAQRPFSDFPVSVRIIQCNDGAYELFACYVKYKGAVTRYYSPDLAEKVLLHYTTRDISRWPDPEEVVRYHGLAPFYFSPMNVNGRVLLAVFQHQRNANWDFLQLFRRKPTGIWEKSEQQINVVESRGAMTWYPRWKYIACWCRTVTRQFPTPFQGPFFLRGPSVEAFFKKPPPKPKPPAKAKAPEKVKNK